MYWSLNPRLRGDDVGEVEERSSHFTRNASLDPRLRGDDVGYWGLDPRLRGDDGGDLQNMWGGMQPVAG